MLFVCSWRVKRRCWTRRAHTHFSPRVRPPCAMACLDTSEYFLALEPPPSDTDSVSSASSASCGPTAGDVVAFARAQQVRAQERDESPAKRLRHAQARQLVAANAAPPPLNKHAQRLIELLASPRADDDDILAHLNLAKDEAAQPGSLLRRSLSEFRRSLSSIENDQLLATLADVLLTACTGASTLTQERRPALPSRPFPVQGDYAAINDVVQAVLDTLRALDSEADMRELHYTWEGAHKRVEHLASDVAKQAEVALCRRDMAQERALELDTVVQALTSAVNTNVDELGGALNAMLEPSSDLAALLEAARERKAEQAEAAAELASLNAMARALVALRDVAQEAFRLVERAQEASMARAREHAAFVEKHCTDALQRMCPMLIEALTTHVQLERERVATADKVLAKARADLAEHDRLFGKDQGLSQRKPIAQQIAEFERIEREAVRHEQALLEEQLTMWAAYGRHVPQLLVADMRAGIVKLLVRNAIVAADLKEGAAETRLVVAADKPRGGMFGWLSSWVRV